MGKAQKKTGKGRLDKYYKLAKYVESLPFALQSLEHILQRTRVPCAFSVQADPAEQEILFLGIRAMLYRSMRCARRMAPGCEQDDACE